jgi:hypothetical protein
VSARLVVGGIGSFEGLRSNGRLQLTVIRLDDCRRWLDNDRYFGE